MSCAAILGFERLSEEGTPDALTEAGAIDAADGSQPTTDARSACSELGIPDPPENAPGGAAAPIIAAFRLLDFGVNTPDGGQPSVPGYNLDRTCSFEVATSSCSTKLGVVAFEQHAKDKTATGVDNAGFSLIEFIGRFSDTFKAETINEGIANGAYGAVVRLDKWNGQANDSDVSVELFPAIGFRSIVDGGARPSFNHDDNWILDDRYKVGGVLEASTVKSDRAYITNGQVVARFQLLSLGLLFIDDIKPFEIRLTDALVTAKINIAAALEDGGSPDSGTRTDVVFSDGVVAGRWKTSDFLGEVRTLFVKNGSGLTNTTVCQPAANLLYNGVKGQVCDGRDLRSDSKDNQNLPCDAISAGARVEAYRVKKLGTFGTSAFADAGVRCTDAGDVPAGDDCTPN